MSRAYKALVVWVVVAMGVWGCAQGQATNHAQTERVKTLENKCTKLEDDYKAVADVRDSLKKRIAGLEEERKSLQEERKKLRKEVENQALIAKERDDLRTQLEQFRKGLRNLLGQAEAALGATYPADSAPPG